MLGFALSDTCEGVTSVGLVDPSCNLGEDLGFGVSFLLLKNMLWECLPSNKTERHLFQVFKRPGLPSDTIRATDLTQIPCPQKSLRRRKGIHFPKATFLPPHQEPRGAAARRANGDFSAGASDPGGRSARPSRRVSIFVPLLTAPSACLGHGTLKDDPKAWCSLPRTSAHLHVDHEVCSWRHKANSLKKT